ncbi:MAG: sigma-70 family RNA polymerase sigma factor [Bryobacteraceae bacterium]|nr:sigma-70 family RNA polymerase sigma factor [Bryobacteraceae bacterium]
MADYVPGIPISAALGDAAMYETADDRLVAALRAGEEDAYETLIQRFQHPVYNLIARLLDDPDDAPDVLQEVFLKVFRKVGTFRRQSSLKTWIYRIAVNEAHNHRRFFSRHRKREIGLDCAGETPGAIEFAVDHSRSAYDLVCDRETQECLEKALAKINPVFRAAVILRDIDELSYDEIAEVLETNLGTVKSRILRGREALRRALNQTEAASRWIAEGERA